MNGFYSLIGGYGDDTILGQGGTDYILGEKGNDSIDGGTDNDTIFGDYTLDDTLDGVGNDTIQGGNGNDGLYGEAGDDTLNGGNDNDWLDPGAGVNKVIGGTGNDTLDVSFKDKTTGIVITADSLGGANSSDGSNWSEIELIYQETTDYNDTIDLSAGNSGNNVNALAGDDLIKDGSGSSYFFNYYGDYDGLEGGDGNDTILGEGGVDWLNGKNGNDSLDGGTGNDRLDGEAGDDTLNGGNDNDQLTPGAGVNKVIGGTGDDTLYASFEDKTTGIAITADSLGGANSSDGSSFSEIEVLFLKTTNQNDTIDLSAGNLENNVDALAGDDLIKDGSNVDDFNYGYSIQGGDGNDTILGEGGRDVIFGQNGNDSLDGGTGTDYLYGGNGNDTLDPGIGGSEYVDGGTNTDLLKLDYSSDNSSGIVSTTPSNGNGTINTTANYVEYGGIEQFYIKGTAQNDNLKGANLADTLEGGGGNDTLNGGAGNDILNGGTGNDSLTGGAGNDLYVVNSASDKVIEASNGGTDTIESTIDYALIAEFENLKLIGTDNTNATGNSLNNILTGNSGNNILDGKEGNDTLIGGAGDDIYTVTEAEDIVTEVANSGTDTVNSALTHTLAENVENLLLTGGENTNATGNLLNNTLTGNSGNNILDGKEGNDTLIGGAGDDIYTVTETGDVVIEAANSGTDNVKASVNHTLAENVENLVLEGTGNIKGTGNSLNNSLIGNSGNNTLDGKLGNDTLDGGAGNDIYVVGQTGDVVIEAASSGIDIVKTPLDYILGENVERLTLIGNQNRSGTGNSLNNILTGNSLNNLLTGNAGNDVLTGNAGNDILVGGAGNDILTGGADADKFEFNALSEKLDTIKDLVSGTDKITINKAGFSDVLAVGVLPDEQFVVGSQALDSNDYFVYNSGQLFFDADGSGSAAQVQLATLTGAPTLTASDIEVF